MVVNVIKGILGGNPNNDINIIKTFGGNEIATVSFLNKCLQSKYKKNYQIYDSHSIEEENKRLFKAMLYSYNIDAEQFEGTIEIYEYE